MKDNMTFIISIYAAIISTLVLLWRIYEFYSGIKGKISIFINEMQVGNPISIETIPDTAKIIPDDLTDYDYDFHDVVEIEILNNGRNKRAIEFPEVLLRQVKNNRRERYFNPSTMAKNYPFQLEPGESYKIVIPLNHLKDWDPNYALEIRCKIIDTYKKVYKTNWIKIKNYAQQAV